MKTLWKFLDGKKTYIAGLWWGVWIPAMIVIWPDGTPEVIGKAVNIIGLLLTYLGLGHATIKAMSK